jgi:hypothetical protein
MAERGHGSTLMLHWIVWQWWRERLDPIQLERRLLNTWESLMMDGIMTSWWW